MEDALTKYYTTQVGSGQSLFYSGPIYQRAGSVQRGSGIGSFLGGLFRRILPILRKGTVAVGKEVINSGANFMNDVRQNVNPSTAFKYRSKEALANLAKKTMYGEGYKSSLSSRKRQSARPIQTVNSSKKKKIVKKKKKIVKPKKKSRDIFTK